MAPCGGEKLGSALAQHTGQEESEAVHDLLGRLKFCSCEGMLHSWETGSPTIQPQILMISMIKSESHHMYLNFSSLPMHRL